MSKKYVIPFLLFAICYSFLTAQYTLDEIVSWELPEDMTFNCNNINNAGSDLNNDGFDDYIYRNNGDPYTFQFFMGSAIPGSTFDFEIEVPFGAGSPSWGGDLNGDGFKDIVYSVCTNWEDPGDIYICYGGYEIDLIPEIILSGEDYVPDAYHLGYRGFNGGYDFNNDGYDDLLANGDGPDGLWNGVVQIFSGGNDFSTAPSFQLDGSLGNFLGQYKAVGDFNGDGFDDLIISRNMNDSYIVKFELYLGDILLSCTPQSVTDQQFQISAEPFISYGSGDLNNDGYEDALISYAGIFLGNAEAELELIYPSNEFLTKININGDVYDDVIYCAASTGIIDICYGSSNFEFNPEISFEGHYVYCNVGDYNNDGEDELLINNGTHPNLSNSVTLYGLTGSSYSEDIVLSTDCSKSMISNYPNPFNPSTTISFELNTESTSLRQGYAGQAENTEVEIYNIKGQKIKSLSPSLCHPEHVEGRGDNTVNTVTWPGTDQSGKPVASGIYFYKLNVENSPVKKMILLK